MGNKCKINLTLCMVPIMQQLRCESNSAGWLEGESSQSSKVGNASSAGLCYYSLVSTKHHHAFENSNSELANLMEAKLSQGIKKSSNVLQSLISLSVLLLFQQKGSFHKVNACNMKCASASKKCHE